MDVFRNTTFGAFEWDSDKDALNRRKHGFGFVDALDVFLDQDRLDIYDDSGDAEDRFKTIGRVKGIMMIVVIHTERNGGIRLISARKAVKKEEKEYYVRLGTHKKHER